MTGPRSLATLLLADWPAVIGEEVARRALPERLTMATPRRENGVLTLRIDFATPWSCSTTPRA